VKERMRGKRVLTKFGIEILFLLSLLTLVLFGQKLFYPNYQNKTEQVQQNFLSLEKKLDDVLRLEKLNFEKTELKGIWTKPTKYDVNLHIYRNDSLLYWNNSDLPILRFADIHFPAEGILHLQNGWYYAKMLRINRVVFCASFLIKKDYSYQNKELVNQFSNQLAQGLNMDISLEQNDHAVYDSKGNFQFSLLSPSIVSYSTTQAKIFLCLFIAVAGLFFWLLFIYWKKLSSAFGVLGLLILGGFWYVLIHQQWLAGFDELEPFQPSLYASNDFFPNFATFLTNVILFVLAFSMVNILLVRMRNNQWKLFALLFCYFGFFVFWHLYLDLLSGLIENSTIPFQINHLFDLNFYSILAIVAMGVLFYGFRRLLHTSTLALSKTRIPLSGLVVATFVSGFLYFLYDINFGHQMLLTSIFPFLFLSVKLYFKGKKQDLVFTQGLVMFFLFTLTLATSIGVFTDRKERSERELYANQLKTDKDILTELEFVKVEAKIRADAYLQRFVQNPQKISSLDFQEGLERRAFGGFWEQYDMEFFLFNPAGIPLVENENKSQKELDRTIEFNGTKSEVDSFSYFIADYVEQYSYLFRLPIYIKGELKAYFYATLKSKRIPEEIGFPRLLISDQAKVFQRLENYSIAKYYSGQLVNRYGAFSYPTFMDAIVHANGDTRFYANYKDYSHYFLKRGANNYVVLSIKNFTWFDLLTTFSYLFCFLGILLLPVLFRLNASFMGKGTLTLAIKIQMVLIGLVFISLLTYGWGSGIFVRDQYNNYTNQVISEKLNSVKLEFQSKFGPVANLTIDKDGNKMSFYLKKFAKVFVTDINFYDTKGYLVASSRPKVFNMGLISEQMNPVALREMKVNFESEFTHQERIGLLDYSSAYVPYFNNEGVMQGFLNLQHFGQQKEFEYQIQRFLTAIINVFMLLLAVSIVIAIFVSGWLTAPLRLLQESFSKVTLGQRNERIHYDKADEIGALVKEYNRKIDELELTAQQLAQSERESAWREMAKQVAHEIKNPLTPMKLGLQHFERLYDPEAPMSKEKFQKMTKSLVEQIDGLTRIANEFSNFAKMPQPQKEQVNLVALIENVVQVFGQDGENKIRLENPPTEIFLSLDKDMMVRVFNNLIKNALQAIQEKEQGEVIVKIWGAPGNVTVEIQDNGKGISEEEKYNIFVPYFTTKSTGTGLGLAMVKQMVELHNGQVSFTSEVGVGTSFFVRLG
jgi:two-component system, NtrC family, nitrogen regulation sensor histidine kinase NtrY